MRATLPIIAFGVLTVSTFAGAGPGPWANGAYYPGQLDGRYSANVYNNVQESFNPGQAFIPNNVVTTNNTDPISGAPLAGNMGAVVSGVVGFGIRNGTPSTGTNNFGSVQNVQNSANVVNSISLDSSHNYFVIYVDGDCFAGMTAAGINLDTQSVHGSLWQGVGQNSYEKVTNWTWVTNAPFSTNAPPFTTVTLLAIPGATANGYFNADINCDQAVFTFFGAGQITTRSTAATKTNNLTYPFNIDGIKSSDNSISGYSLGGRNAP